MVIKFYEIFLEFLYNNLTSIKSSTICHFPYYVKNSAKHLNVKSTQVIRFANKKFPWFQYQFNLSISICKTSHQRIFHPQFSFFFSRIFRDSHAREKSELYLLKIHQDYPHNLFSVGENCI